MVKTKRKQLSFADAMQAAKLKQQKECKHDFMIIQHFDYENDKVYYQAVCRKCDYLDD